MIERFLARQGGCVLVPDALVRTARSGGGCQPCASTLQESKAGARRNHRWPLQGTGSLYDQ